MRPPAQHRLGIHLIDIDHMIVSMIDLAIEMRHHLGVIVMTIKGVMITERGVATMNTMMIEIEIERETGTEIDIDTQKQNTTVIEIGIEAEAEMDMIDDGDNHGMMIVQPCLLTINVTLIAVFRLMISIC